MCMGEVFVLCPVCCEKLDPDATECDRCGEVFNFDPEYNEDYSGETFPAYSDK